MEHVGGGKRVGTRFGAFVERHDTQLIVQLGELFIGEPGETVVRLIGEGRDGDNPQGECGDERYGSCHEFSEDGSFTYSPPPIVFWAILLSFRFPLAAGLLSGSILECTCVPCDGMRVSVKPEANMRVAGIPIRGCRRRLKGNRNENGVSPDGYGDATP